MMKRKDLSKEMHAWLDGDLREAYQILEATIEGALAQMKEASTGPLPDDIRMGLHHARINFRLALDPLFNIIDGEG